MNGVTPFIGWYDTASTTPPLSSPLILDLDGDGVETTAVTDGAYFDHDKNGFAEQTGWVSPDDGILVRDVNNDGIINDGSEVFGNNTTQGQANGFLVLDAIDAAGNDDGKIDSSDTTIWSQLKIWQDIDGDGYSSEDELFTLSELNIKSISTAYTTSTYVDENDNEHRQVGTFTWTDDTTSTATDVWFKVDPAYTIANEWLDITDESILALPDLQGYGNVYDLHQAMVRDTSGDLEDLVQALVDAEDAATRNALDTNAYPSDTNGYDLTDKIILKWTGAGARLTKFDLTLWGGG